MNHPNATGWKPAATSIAFPGHGLADKIRFVGGIAISLGGAAVLLSDLIALVPSFD